MPKRSTLRLTTRSVAALPVTGKDTVYWDRDLAGFGVRVQRNGRKVYVVQSRGPAGLQRVTLGPCAGEAIEVRRREAAAIIDRVKRGLDPIPPEPEPEPTVADLAARCIARLRERSLQAKDGQALSDGHRQAHRSVARNRGSQGRPVEGCHCAPSAPP